MVRLLSGSADSSRAAETAPIDSRDWVMIDANSDRSTLSICRSA